MSALSKGEKERFEKFLASLPSDRKKALYTRFRQMDAEERNVAIRRILAKTEAGRKTNGSSVQKNKPQNAASAQKVPGRPQGKPEGQPQGKSSPQQRTKPVQGNAVRQKSLTKTAPVQSHAVKEQDKRNTRPNFNRIVNVLTVIVALGCLATLALTYFTNREDIDGLFARNETTVTTSATDTSSDDTEAAASASESGSGTETETTTATTTTNDPSVPTPSPTEVPVKNNAPDLSGFSIVIDPMHQAKTSENTESLMPDKGAFKASSTEGGKGVTTGVSESELVLQYALCAKEYLEKCGAKVVLTRTTNDIDLSNQDRARIATSSDCDIYLRLEARAAEDPGLTGVRVCIPEYGKYKTRDLSTAKDLAKMISSAENLEDGGAATSMAYTGLNYATSVHAFQLNLGFLSNEKDETILTDSGNIYNVAVCLSEFCSEIKK